MSNPGGRVITECPKYWFGSGGSADGKGGVLNPGGRAITACPKCWFGSAGGVGGKGGGVSNPGGCVIIGFPKYWFDSGGGVCGTGGVSNPGGRVITACPKCWFGSAGGVGGKGGGVSNPGGRVIIGFPKCWFGSAGGVCGTGGVSNPGGRVTIGTTLLVLLAMLLASVAFFFSQSSMTISVANLWSVFGLFSAPLFVTVSSEMGAPTAVVSSDDGLLAEAAPGTNSSLLGFRTITEELRSTVGSGTDADVTTTAALQQK